MEEDEPALGGVFILGTKCYTPAVEIDLTFVFFGALPVLVGIFFLIFFMIHSFQKRKEAKLIVRQFREWAARSGQRPFSAPYGKAWAELFSACRRDFTYYARLVPTRGAGENSRLDIAVKCKIPVELVATRENALHKLSKKVRLNEEFQTGDAAFDDAVYLEGEGDLVYDQYFSAPSTRAIVAGLLAQIQPGPTLSFKGGEIVLAISPITPERMAALKLDRIIDGLISLAADIEAKNIPPCESAPDYAFATGEKGKLSGTGANTLHAAGILLGIGGWYLGFYNSDLFVHVDFAIFDLALGAAVLLTSLFFMLGYFAFRGRSYSHKLVAGIFSGYFAASLLFCYHALCFLNCRLDRGPADCVQAIVWGIDPDEKKVMLREEGGKEWKNVSLPGKYFKQGLITPQAEIEVWPGRFGYKWIRRIEFRMHGDAH